VNRWPDKVLCGQRASNGVQRNTGDTHYQRRTYPDDEAVGSATSENCANKDTQQDDASDWKDRIYKEEISMLPDWPNVHDARRTHWTRTMKEKVCLMKGA
jgi:hypothetical protein